MCNGTRIASPWLKIGRLAFPHDLMGIASLLLESIVSAANIDVGDNLDEVSIDGVGEPPMVDGAGCSA